jgi:RsiW-degrading membrane proteinase PrsW (M82 family)
MSTAPNPPSSKRYFHTDGKEVFGPFDEKTIIELETSRSITRETLVCEEGSESWVKLSDSALADHLPKRPQPPPSSLGVPAVGISTDEASAQAKAKIRAAVDISKKAATDISHLRMQLLLPLFELRSMAWLQNKSALGMMVVGLTPLVLMFVIGGKPEASYYGIAFYFAAMWGLYFYGAFAPDRVTVGTSLLCFFVTALVSIPIFLSIYYVPPFGYLLELAQSDALPTRFVGMLTAVAIPEEICKALVLFYLVRTATARLHPNTIVFYGLMSGLGFGIYEGVKYQMGFNRYAADTFSELHSLNVMRLTSLPFIHAIWTGIAGYFIGLSAVYPSRKHGLIVVAILIPAVFHAIHNTFGIFALATDAISVLALLVYLAKSNEIEAELAKDRSAESVESKSA